MKILASLWGILINFLLGICAQFQIENYFFLGNSHFTWYESLKIEQSNTKKEGCWSNK